ncbi:MAG: tetraacyldisaccharide 4'-kinase [Moraxella sp.]|nr:tetraacyldisaccharide 4'-kinase [Moraxella sp.]
MSNKKNTHLSHRQRLELGMTAAWETEAKWLPLLRPLSKTYQFFSEQKKSHYASGKKSAYHAPVPVLVVGNITVGGSGKTPLIIALVKYLQSKGVAVGVISRGYGREGSEPALVHADSTPKDAGDEPCLIVSETGVPMAVGVNRGQAIDLLIKNHPNLQLIISDDGLQHYALHRDVEWIVVDVARGFGNGKLLPEGFLREPLSRLEGADVIYHHKNAQSIKDSTHTATMYLAPARPVPLLGGVSEKQPPTGRVYAMTGIGYPARFFEMLTALGFSVVSVPKPDHHVFSSADFTDLTDLPIFITAKDAIKVRTLVNEQTEHLFKNTWVLPVTAVLSEGVKAMADALVERLGL